MGPYLTFWGSAMTKLLCEYLKFSLGSAACVELLGKRACKERSERT